MSDDRLHVVFGAGQVGTRARSASRRARSHGAGGVTESALGAGRRIEWRAADATDPDAAADAAAGASVIYQCLNAPYTDWPRLFPPLQRGVMAAAERTGALLVSLENIYGYGPTGGRGDDRRSAPGRNDRQGPNPSGDDPGAARRRRGRAGPHRDRSSVGLLRRRGHRDIARGTRLRQRRGREARGLHRQPRPARTPTATSPTSQRAWRPSVPTSGPSAAVWHLPGPETVTTRRTSRAGCRRGRTPGRRSLAAQARRPRPRRVQPDDARAGRDVLRVRRAVRARHHQVPVHVRDRRHAVAHGHHRNGRLVPGADTPDTPQQKDSTSWPAARSARIATASPRNSRSPNSDRSPTPPPASGSSSCRPTATTTT